jgi:hypothetical protein
MGLKFRRGTTAEKSGSLAFGEPYVNTTLGTLQIGGTTGDITLSTSGTGSTGNFGAISGSGLDITGNANVAGNLTLGGQLTIGDNTSDTVNVVASLSSSLIPQTTNVFDLGSASKIWRDLYISTGSIKFVNPAGTVVSTLSVNADGSQTFPSDLIVNGLTVGKGLNSGSTNTAVGVSALGANTTGTTNTAIGHTALQNNTTGVSNTAIGAWTLTAITTANANTAVGWGALRYNTTANSNTAVGSGAMQNNTTGNGNTAVGNASLATNTTGVNNTALGTNALADNVGNYNVGVGALALRLNVSGSSNIAIGHSALEWHTTGQGNTVIGDTAGNLITTGSYNTIIGKYTGEESLSNNIVLADGQGNIKYRWDGTNNNIYGNVNVSGSITGQILSTNGIVSGSSQVIGILSSLNTYTGSNDTTNTTQNSRLDQLSTASGSAITRLTALEVETANLETFTSSINTTIKTRLNAETVVSGSSQITLSSTTGYGSVLNQAVLTTSSPTFAGLTINGAITATGDITAFFTSDKRHKNNIQTIPNALEKVTKLNGVTWEWNDDVNEVTKSTPKTGLIAQEVQEVLPEVVKEREDGFLALDYSKMMGLMVEAIKEQQKQIDSLLIKINQLENK